MDTDQYLKQAVDLHEAALSALDRNHLDRAAIDAQLSIAAALIAIAGSLGSIDLAATNWDDRERMNQWGK